MENSKTIVAAFDLEAGSDAVLGRAIQLAKAHASELVVLHVIEATSWSPTYGNDQARVESALHEVEAVQVFWRAIA